MRRALAEAGIVFMYAPAMHPAMRHVGPVRRELAVPTVMNLVGPLANPAGAGRQVVGVADRARMPLLADALCVLGARHCLVVHGEPGLDEVSPCGPTHVIEVREGHSRSWTFEPEAAGLDRYDPGELAGGDPAANAAIILEILSGGGAPAARAAVMLNAGAPLYVAGLAPTIGEGAAIARAAIEQGAARRALDALRAAYAR